MAISPSTKTIEKKIKFAFIHFGGIGISLITLLPMSWKMRIQWAKLVYKMTYVSPSKHPTFMAFIEESNAKYQMGKRKKGMYETIEFVRQQHEQASA